MLKCCHEYCVIAMVIYFLRLCVVFVIVFNILYVESAPIRKRSVRGNKLRPSNKSCLDFCVYTNCNMGTCILDSTTCFASCVCHSNFTGRWCENEIETQNSKGSLVLFMSQQHAASVVEKRIPNNSFANITTEAVMIPDLSGIESNNSTEHILRNKTIYPSNFISRRESWMECTETCTEGGRCVEINGSYTCSKNDFSCWGGFECTHGVCFKGETENRPTIKCVCEYGWIGTFCRQTCSKDCGMNGQCTITDKKSGTTKCVCYSNYSGPYCTVKKVYPIEDDISFHWYVIGACAGVGTLLLLMLILLPYCIWKKRRSFIMKIIHYFQNYEDDDGKTYDAFISYKSSKTDQDFILKQLYPRLELEMGYKLCLHFRDFTPGDVIANNIIKAVEDSRRTIMVISQNYIESEWCRMEYQKAQHEMLKMKHRIIPIILEDISHLKTDKNLKSIINSVTYIEWPGETDSKKLERFWKQLKLSMPKKQLHGQPNTVFSVSQTSTPFSESCSRDLSSSDFRSSDIQSSKHDTQHLNVPSESVLESNMDDPRSKYKSNRIKTLLRNPFQLNITSDNFKRLSRTCSKDSGVSSPATASPSSVSPLFNKDLNPLLPRKHIDIRHNNSKGLIFKHGFQNKLSEKCNVYNITCDEGSNIPDVCKITNKDNNGPGVYNISPTDTMNNSQNMKHTSNNCQTCIFKQEVSNEFINPGKTIGKSDCDTCILPNDSPDSNLSHHTCILPNGSPDINLNHHKIINGKIENTLNLNYNNKTKTL